MPGKPQNTFLDLLISEGVLSKKRARDVAKASGRQKKSPVEIALDEGAVSVGDLERVARTMGLGSPDLTPSAVDWACVGRLTLAEARSIPALPLLGGGDEVQVATVDPLDAELNRSLTDRLGKPVSLLFAAPQVIRTLLSQGPEVAPSEVPAAASPGEPGTFGGFVSDESQHRVVEELRHFLRTETEWRRPVLLVGVGCVGKSHLLRAAHHELGKLYPNRAVLFVSGREVKSASDPFAVGKTHDGLIVDDLDALAGDTRSEELLMQAFNAAFKRGAPIVLSSGKPLAAVDELSMRVRAALGICRQLTLTAPREQVLEIIARRAAARAGMDPGGVNWSVLVQESGGDLRRIMEAIQTGGAARASARTEAVTSPPVVEETLPPEQGTAASTRDLLREEAEAIISEAQAAIQEIEQRPAQADEALLGRAREALRRAIEARDAGDYVASEQLGMEALERAALAHSGAPSTVPPPAPPTAEPRTPSQPREPLSPYVEPEGTDAQVKAALRDAEKAVREACDDGAEEYASRELRTAINGLEEARRIAADPALRARAIDEARLAAEQARDAARRAKTRKEEARIKQEKEKVRRCQMAIEEVRREHGRLVVNEGDTPISAQLEEVEVLIDTAVQYQEVGSIGQALEQVMKARRRLNEIAEEARQRRELRDTINEVDGLVRDVDRRGEAQNPQQLVDIQNALAEAERVLMGDSADYELGLNWARVARQKALRLAEAGADRRVKEVQKPKRPESQDLTFETLEVCEGNQFVVAMARTAAETPHLVKSPLYVWGDVGVGKSHLLAAVCDLAKKTHPDRAVIFTTATDFSENYREALALGKASAFREAHRSADLLILDDLHHLIENGDGMREFFHTLSAIEASGGLAIVSASLPPRKLGIDDRSFRSRLEGGVTAEMKYPSLEARERILRREAKRYELRIPDEAITLLATMITTNVRELLGALGKVAAHSRAAGGQVTGEIMRKVLQEVLPGPSEEDRWPRS